MNTFPLVTHTDLAQPVAWRRGAAVSVSRFLHDVASLAAVLPAGGHAFNACNDRYRFVVALAAALVSNKISLLPPSQTAQTVRQMKAFAPDVFCIVDGPSAIDMPQFLFDESLQVAEPPGAPLVPGIPATRTMAIVFTSGSTGTPVAHRKRWGDVVRSARAEGAVLALASGTAPNVLGTVPPQHMYGFESTVLMPLQCGGTLSAAHPFYPADICAALAEMPRPRLLVTTPVHLRTLLDSGVAVPAIDLILSATAPLSEQLAASAEARLGAPLHEIYGSTETGQIASRRSTQTREWSLMGGVRLSQRGDRCWASGGHVDPEMPLGDLIELLEGGSFLLHGRIGDLVNIAGKRNSLSYLDHQLLAIDGVVDGAFFMPAEEAQDGVTRLGAFVVAPGLSEDAVRAALRACVDPAFMPRPLLFLDKLPRERTGKLTRATIDGLAGSLTRRVGP